MRIAVALHGLKASGKSTVADLLVARLGWPILRTGDALRSLMATEGLEISAASLAEFSDTLRRSHPPVLGHLLRARFPDVALPDHLIIDSVRERQDIEELHRLGYDTTLVEVVTSVAERGQRVRVRNRPDDPKNLDALHKYDAWDRGLRDAGLGQGSHVRIFNTADRARLNRRVCQLCNKVKTHAGQAP